MSTITAEKAALRKAVKGFHLSGKDREASDALLLSRFLALPQVAEADALLLFYGVGDEPDTARLLGPLAHKTLALPRCLPGGTLEARRCLGPDHLLPGPLGIPEPDGECPLLARDCFPLILVPNLCCDQRGCRLGHGGGYYDRYLAGFSGLTVCLCRDALLQARVPTQAHDLGVDLVLTETRSLSFSGAARSGANRPASK